MKVERVVELSLGIVTSVGGFLEVGELTTTAAAGASYGLQLLWAVAIGAIVLAAMIEMSGRFAAVSHHTIVDAMRERFGAQMFLIPLVVTMIVSILLLVTELGGMTIALELATGISARWWSIVAAVITWLLLWRGTFGLIEKGVAILGLVAIAFAVAMFKNPPDTHAVLAGLLPSLPLKDPVQYWFITVGILGASITPSVFYFYSGGAIEDKWDASWISTNRFVAWVGILFGGALSGTVLVVAASVLRPAGITADHYVQLPLMLVGPLGRAGFWLFVATLFISSFSAALEVAISIAYFAAQGLGWNWGENFRPRADARFSITYTVAIVLAALILLAGASPLKVTLFTMALTAATLPIAVLPFLVLMNDRRYLREHTNGAITNAFVLVTVLIAGVLAVVSIPLELLGG